MAATYAGQVEHWRGYLYEKLATLGAALRPETGTRVLDLGSGSGEMLCTWARDHGVVGTGIDLSQLFTEQARLRAATFGGRNTPARVEEDAADLGAAQARDRAAFDDAMRGR